MGLNNILIGSEKFANQTIKVQVFIQRLKQARETFINEFLSPEIRRISKDLGFKNYPTAHFQDIDIKDDIQYSRIYTRLVELGMLTPEEGIKAIDTGVLPSVEDSITSQQKFRELKDQGLYQPLVGGSAQAPQAGRPAGSTGIPQQTKNVKPIGQGKQSKAEFFDLDKIKNNFLLASKLQDKIESTLKEKHSLRKLSKQQKEVAFEVSKIIISNEIPETWESSIEEYIKNPKDKNIEKIYEIQSIAADHSIDTYIASILYHSKQIKE